MQKDTSIIKETGIFSRERIKQIVEEDLEFKHLIVDGFFERKKQYEVNYKKYLKNERFSGKRKLEENKAVAELDKHIHKKSLDVLHTFESLVNNKKNTLMGLKNESLMLKKPKGDSPKMIESQQIKKVN